MYFGRCAGALAKLLEGNFNSGFLQRVRSHHNVVVEDRLTRWLPHQNQIHIRFHNLHMLWMCIWMSPYHVTDTATLTSQSFEVFPWILDTSWGSDHSIVWRLRLLTHLKWLPHQYQTHPRYVSQSSHALEVNMEESVPYYHCSCWPSCWKLVPPRVMIASWGQSTA